MVTTGSSWAPAGEEFDIAAGPTVKELIGLLFRVTGELRQRFTERSASFDLSFAQAMALRELDQPLPMRDLADRLCCDASNVTGIVDRLEARGVVERQVVPGDRRVKRLVLTEEGRRLWQAHHDRVLADVPLVAGLSAEERIALYELLARAVASSGAPG